MPILQKFDKKSLIYLGIVILAILISLFLSWYFSRVPEQMPESKEVLPPSKPSQEEIIKKQLEELETLRTETATLTEKEIQTQLKELQTLQKKTKSLSEEQIQKQLEELNKLRAQQ